MNASVKENRKFGWLVGAAFLILTGYRFYKSGNVNLYLAGISLTLLFLALVRPQWLTRPRRGWENLGEVLGYINSVVLLTVVYLFIVTPLGVISRLLGNDPLKLKIWPTVTTYWETTDNNDSPAQMEQQF